MKKEMKSLSLIDSNSPLYSNREILVPKAEQPIA